MLSSTDGIEMVKGREKVVEVDLSSNNIESFGLANGLQWRSLLVLNLASCMLSKLYRIEWPPQLRHFIVSNNRLKRFDCALPKTLESLECQHNRLETLEEAEGLKRLSRLNASHNALTWGTVRDALRSLSGLVVLDLGYNPIDKIEVGVFVRIRGLQELTLDGCRLKSLGFVPEGNVLSVLSVACNRLKGIQGLPVCERLTELYLSSNRLSTLRGLARACPNVEVLQLMNNKLEEGRSVAEELTALKDLAELTHKACTAAVSVCQSWMGSSWEGRIPMKER
ncbi:leucine rich repeat protein 1, putative [Perkinsus marinus ATCC 50983]|uniref:Leucine rich repeat protein 1, putative n=1 Tax=Perkinsus marinus (strain ATCC 50983 / TXsc) TaxID=423536 RepID=C5KZY6_PERM5|nr:leucine rich repeat protein 1, putative [Perkinsus marinus ATCC 50983]EER09844.1 leucine rich repeat protein 1, putative [Perkinsus marinus ATCC 50983]|eukprot:XP_002778049.1 leucine rich repeat protein 1, putative [Perkinsus marinus ATCC 50983]